MTPLEAIVRLFDLPKLPEWHEVEEFTPDGSVWLRWVLDGVKDGGSVCYQTWRDLTATPVPVATDPFALMVTALHQPGGVTEADAQRIAAQMADDARARRRANIEFPNRA